MLRLLTILLISANIGSLAQAQMIRGYGIKAGLTLSDVHSPELTGAGGTPISFDTVHRTGFVALGFVEWLKASPLSIITEAGYVQRGFAIEFEGRDAQNNPTGKFRTEDRFDYLQLVVLAKLRLPQTRLSPYIIIGPHLGLFLGGDPDGEGSLADSYASTAFGGTGGGGIEVALQVPIFVEIRYSIDLTNSLPDVPRDAYNNAIEVVAGIRL